MNRKSEGSGALSKHAAKCAVQRSDSKANSINTSSTFYHFNLTLKLRRLSIICITFHYFYYRTYRHVCRTRILLPRWKWGLPSFNLRPCRWVHSFCRNLVDFAVLAWFSQRGSVRLQLFYLSTLNIVQLLADDFALTEWCRRSVNTNEHTGHFSDIYRLKGSCASALILP